MTSSEDSPKGATLAIDIRGGIEWFVVPNGREMPPSDECQCARCGSSCEWKDCWNCDNGLVEKDVGDGIVEDLEDFECEYCRGSSGSYHCLSSPEWCEVNPLPDRAHIPSTALRAEAWTN